ncbi:hypothetical protein GM3708_3630 (plasmid) [Geminocystis sp. NIES-3708]|uniref:hypothetical protein n=1 Tax=Geminocystis sp. NIES-3708 TaxID=1615909 RepID=UPI0005FC7302|nr:hypothetical protein [Geminocystis sp. NIES-3708]BAQ63224.1 hypothetical protein GM3708_3630 [Geminocystis sp. NIES-3708]
MAIRLKDEYREQYKARIKELESRGDGKDPFVELDNLRDVRDLMVLFLADIQDSDKIIQIEE